MRQRASRSPFTVVRATKLVGLFVVLLTPPTIDAAHGDGAAVFPKYNIAKACRAQADYAFAATLGQTDTDREIAACSEGERESMVSVRTFWSRVSPKDLAECLALAEERYGRLARCLETSPSLRTIR